MVVLINCIFCLFYMQLFEYMKRKQIYILCLWKWWKKQLKVLGQMGYKKVAQSHGVPQINLERYVIRYKGNRGYTVFQAKLGHCSTVVSPFVLYDKHELCPRCIFHVNETGILTVPRSHSKNFSAVGNYMLPIFIFPRTGMKSK